MKNTPNPPSSRRKAGPYGPRSERVYPAIRTAPPSEQPPSRRKANPYDPRSEPIPDLHSSAKRRATDGYPCLPRACRGAIPPRSPLTAPRVLRLLRFALLAAFGASAAHSADANPTYEPPEEAMPGLRYYEPKTTVDPRTVTTDVCVYGGTSGGVIAAVQAARMGRDVVLLEFGRHVGGLTTGGLVRTDGGGPDVTGGLAAEFYGQVGREMFSPEAAEAVFREMLEEAGVDVRFRAHLESVDKAGTRIESITMEDGLTVRAKQFIDATYEGDLLARAGVSYAVGREPNSLYGETYNGIREPGTGGHNIPVDISAYVRPGDPSSGLLPRVTSERGEVGAGDKSIQAYCFRMWLTRDNPRPIPKPTDYDPLEYEILARIFEAGVNPNIFDAPDHNRKAPRRLDPVDGVRFSNDTNNHHLFAGAYFIDYVGGADGWPEGNYRERERIFQEHANYQIGLMWFLQNSDRIPEKWQKEFRKWGLPRDIYEDTGGWPHQLYIREARRMKSDYVMTEHNCLGRVVPEDSVGIASYTMDSHHCRLVEVDGIVLNEGNVEVSVRPYPVAYRALTPKREECTNLLVPVALSSSHIAFGSMRMEPVFMLLGQSAAAAASLAIDDGVAVQDVGYPKLRKQLLADGQILEHPAFATPEKTETPNQAMETTEIEKALPVTRNFLEKPSFQLQAVLAIDACNLLKINLSLRSVLSSITYSYPKRVIAKLLKPQSK